MSLSEKSGDYKMKDIKNVLLEVSSDGCMMRLSEREIYELIQYTLRIIRDSAHNAIGGGHATALHQAYERLCELNAAKAAIREQQKKNRATSILFNC